MAVLRKETIRKNTVKKMKTLGTYQPSFDTQIDIYAEMLYQYSILTIEFENSGYECKTTTGAGGEKKSALVSTLESLRKDILQYADRLMLTPKSYKDIPDAKAAPVSDLSKVLSEIGL